MCTVVPYTTYDFILYYTDTVGPIFREHKFCKATVQLKALPGEWGNRVWAGHVSSTKQKATSSENARLCSRLPPKLEDQNIPKALNILKYPEISEMERPLRDLDWL